MKKQILAIILVTVMLFSQMSIVSFATNDGVFNITATAKRDLIENWDGTLYWHSTDYDENGEPIEWGDPYFVYDLLMEDFEYSFTFNGEDYVGDYEYVYEIVGEYPSIYASQWPESWGVGTHEVKVEILNYCGTGTIKVVETPVESVVATPKQDLIENYDCSYIGEWYDGETVWSPYYYTDTWYSIDDGIGIFEYEITYKNGTAIVGDYFEIYDLTGYEVRTEDDQSHENQWGVGTHNVDVNFLGCLTTTQINVVETPVESIVATPKRDLVVNFDGEYTTEWYYDDEAEDLVESEEYFCYTNFLDNFEFVITYKDGTVYSGDTWEIKEATGVCASYNTNQSYKNPWGIGTHNVQFNYHGKIITVPINVIESPIESIVATSTKDLIENYNGYYMTDYYWDEETQDWAESEEYFYYATDLEYVVTYKDGTVYIGDEYAIEEATGCWPEFNNYQSYDNQWGVGTHSFEVSILGTTATATVNVIESPVASIVATSTKDLVEYQDGFYTTDEYWDDDLQEWVESEEYYIYPLWLELTITYKDGTVYTGDIWEIEEATGYDVIIGDDQSRENQWDVGTHVVGISFMGVETTVNVNVVESDDAVLSGWINENGKWAYYEDGVKATNRWLMDSVGWCYVGADGYCVTNCWKADSKGWCYLDANGRMATNKWIKDSVGWCYVGADGYCVTNKWVKDSVGWCYLDANGRMATNKWIKDSVGWCYVGANGYCVTNKWVKDSTGWCYLDSNGRMVYNKWVKDSVGWCYVGSSGYMVTNQWVKDGNYWYYLDGNGYMVTGTKVIGGKTYKFNSSGVWIG